MSDVAPHNARALSVEAPERESSAATYSWISHDCAVPSLCRSRFSLAGVSLVESKAEGAIVVKGYPVVGERKILSAGPEADGVVSRDCGWHVGG